MATACRPRRPVRVPRLGVVQFEIDQTSLIAASSDLLKIRENKELIADSEVICNVDGVFHEANLLYLTDDREEAHAFDTSYWAEKNAEKEVNIFDI